MFCAVLLVFGLLTHERNEVWRNDLSLSRDMVKRSPGKSRGYVSLGLAYYAQGDADKAVEEYYAALSVDPNCAPAYHNLGVALTARNLIDKAIESFEAALRILNNMPARARSELGRSSLVHHHLADLYQRQDRHAEAMEQYTLAILADEGNPQLYIDRGIAYLDARSYDLAVGDFTSAIARDPVSAIAYMNRGNALDEKGETRQAIEDYNKAIRIDPGYANAYYNRGIAYYRMRNMSASHTDLQKACDLGNRQACEAMNTVRKAE